jgi:hypothetical protein
MAALLLAAVRLARRPTTLLGVILPVVLIVVVVPVVLQIGAPVLAGRLSTVALALMDALAVAIALVPFLLVLPFVFWNPWLRWGGVIGVVLLGFVALSLGMSLGLPREQWSPLADTVREAAARADSVREAASRADTNEVVVLSEPGSVRPVQPLQALLRGDVAVRLVPAVALLPVERETVFVLAPGAATAVELGRSSSAIPVMSSDGTDTGAVVVALRARPAADWLARLASVENGRFQDGSALVGVATEVVSARHLDLLLYWRLPAASDGRNLALAGVVRGRTDTGARPPTDGRFDLPSVEARRTGELVVVRASIADPDRAVTDGRVSISLLDVDGRPVRTAGGQETLDIPVGRYLP